MSQLEGDVLELGADLPELGADVPELGADAPELATDAPELATDTPELTTDTPELPTDAPELAADAPEIAADAPELASDAPDLAADLPDLAADEQHLFILSSAGKPIYSRCGREERLTALCGVVQALVSVARGLRCVRAGACVAVFRQCGPLVLVAVARAPSRPDERVLALQLTYAFSQIVSVLTLSQLTRVFEQRHNYDLRRLLAGAERLVGGAAAWAAREPAAALGGVRVLPLPPAVREHVHAALAAACAPLRHLVFAVVVAGDRLVGLARRRKYSLHPTDLHLLLNLVRGSEAFRAAESWTPLCLPKFDATGFLHAHVSYLEESAACLLLLTVHRDEFYALSRARRDIGERLQRHDCLSAVDAALAAAASPLSPGAAEVNEFVYQCRSTAQVVVGGEGAASARLVSLLAAAASPAPASSPAATVKLLCHATSRRALLVWVTSTFSLGVCLPPLSREAAVLAVDRLLRWLRRERDSLFILSPPTF